MRAANTEIPLGGSYIFDSFQPSLPRQAELTATAPDFWFLLDYWRCRLVASSFLAAGKRTFVTGVRTDTAVRAYVDALADLHVKAKIYCGQGVCPPPGCSLIELGTDNVFDVPEMYAMRDWVADPDDFVFIPESLGVGPEAFRSLGLKAAQQVLQGLFCGLSEVSMPPEKGYILAAALELGSIKLELQTDAAELRYVTVAGCATAIINESVILPPEVVRGIRGKRIDLVPLTEPRIIGRLML